MEINLPSRYGYRPIRSEIDESYCWAMVTFGNTFHNIAKLVFKLPNNNANEDKFVVQVWLSSNTIWDWYCWARTAEGGAGQVKPNLSKISKCICVKMQNIFVWRWSGETKFVNGQRFRFLCQHFQHGKWCHADGQVVQKRYKQGKKEGMILLVKRN